MAQSPTDQKQKALKQLRQKNVLESLKDIGGGATKSVGADLIKDTSSEFVKQLFGIRQQQKKYEGEIRPGEEVRLEEVYSGEHEKKEKLQKQLSYERRLREEEKGLFERESQNLRLQLKAITDEVKALAAATPKLAQEIEVAAIQAPANPGIYHLFFFEKLLVFIRNFRERVQNASTWLSAVNKRGQKKNFWGRYKSKHGGASFLLSQEHYSQRSAG